MLNIGPQELLLILIIALLVVGPQRLPELGRSIGRWMRELRNAQEEVRRTIRVGLDESNGDANTRPGTATAGSATPAGDAQTPPASDAQSPTPTAGTTPTTDEIRDISRSLGKSLGQIRRAREEVQRSFRVDLNAPAPKPSTSSTPGDAAPSREPSNGDARRTPPLPGEPTGDPDTG